MRSVAPIDAQQARRAMRGAADGVDRRQVTREQFVADDGRAFGAVLRSDAADHVLELLRPEVVGRLAIAAATYARAQGFDEDGYRIVMNCNGDAGQTVFQIHLHLLAGAPLGRFGTPG